MIETLRSAVPGGVSPIVGTFTVALLSSGLGSTKPRASVTRAETPTVPEDVAIAPIVNFPLDPGGNRGIEAPRSSMMGVRYCGQTSGSPTLTEPASSPLQVTDRMRNPAAAGITMVAPSAEAWPLFRT